MRKRRDEQGTLVQNCRRVSSIPERESSLTVAGLKINILFPPGDFIGPQYQDGRDKSRGSNQRLIGGAHPIQ